MRHGFLKDGASRFLLSVAVISAIGLGIGAGGPALLGALSKPARAQDIMVLPKNQQPNNPANTPYVGMLPSVQQPIGVRPGPVQQEMPAPAALRIVPNLEEPLVATGPTTAEEDAALTAATAAFVESSKATDKDFPEQAAPLLAFVAKYPDSGWTMAVQTDLGLRYYNAGYYSRAIDAWQQAWQLGRSSQIIEAKRLTDRAVGELLRMHARLGHADEIDKLLADLGDRPLTGAATEFASGAREGAWVMRNRPEIAYLCGPKALVNVMRVQGAPESQVKIANDAESGHHGYNLTQLSALADKAGVAHQLVYRAPGQPVPVPSIINWKLNHYAAIVAEQGGHFIVKDPTFADGDRVVTRDAIDAEGSGYFLVPAGAAKSVTGTSQGAAAPTAAGDWRTVDAASDEAKAIYGMGFSSGQNPLLTFIFGLFCNSCATANQSSPDANMSQIPPLGTDQMTVASGHMNVVTLTLSDVPVGYRASKGPQVKVALVYNHREATQPANFSWFNVGQKWNITWQSYIVDNPGSAGYAVVRYPGGGGGISEYNYHSADGTFTPELVAGATLKRIPAGGTLTSYELVFQDGSKEVYSQTDGATTAPRKVFLTQRIDAQGNAVTLAYDASYRLTTITDAAGKVTTFTYGLVSYPLLVTQVTDPFGRSTNLTYDASQHLASITDPAGIVSSFSYTGDFINTLNTPYGTSTFAFGEDAAPPSASYYRWLELTDPLSAKERLEYNNNPSDIAASDDPATIPTGMTGLYNGYFKLRNTFYWDKHVVGVAGTTDHNKAVAYHWNHDYQNGSVTVPEFGTFKRPLENRVWFNYALQTDGNWSGISPGPTATGRVLDDGSTQLTKATYKNVTWTVNGNHVPATTTDALGRTQQFTYATGDIDLTKVEQQISATPTWATLATMTYNAAHRPLTYTDAAGQLWQYAYNAAGQMIYATDPLGETRFWEYDASGRITRVTTPVAVAFASVVYGTTNVSAPTAQSFNYTAACSGVTAPANTNLPISVTDSEGRVLCYQYDNLDRVVKVKYPDGTTDAYDYTFPAGWIANGVNYGGTQSLDVWKVTDRLGRITNYSYDRNRRLISTSETIKVGGVDVVRTMGYSYYENGVLKELADANGAVTHWEIDLQSRPTSKTYAYGTANAKTETYTYETTTSRLKSRTDARGQTVTFTYNKDNTVASYAYTGAVVATAGASFTYDPWYPRRTGMTDQYGTTSWTYKAVGVNGALGLDTEDGPFSNDTVAYGYDPLGRVSSRTVPGGSAETIGYDLLGRPNSHTTDLGSFTYGYLGNSGQVAGRTVGSVVTSWGYDTNTNDRRLLTINTTGAVARSFSFTSNAYQISGITDTPAATHPWLGQTWSYSYDASDRLLNGTGSIAGSSSFSYDKLDNATSFAGLTGTYNNLNQISTFNGVSFAYDANGNLTSDGTRTYTYDAADRLLTVTQGAAVTTFGYDGLGRRVKQTYVNGTTTNTRYLWCGSSLCQIRDGSDVVTTKLFAEGEYRISGTKKYLYLSDHLGNVRDVIDITGTATLVGSFDYTPYGALARSWGTVTPVYQYAQLQNDVGTGLYLSVTRIYNPANGQWLNRDPIREAGGINPYSYSNASPTAKTDWLGLQPQIDLIPTTPEKHRAANEAIESVPGYFVVAAHANPYELFGPNKESILPGDLAKMIKN